MAQKKQQYEDAADSIFNFIFRSARKNLPPKQRPRIKGVAGDDMAYALGEVVMHPAIYANEEVLNFINEPFENISIAEGKIALDDELAVKVGVDASNLSDFLSDPEAFIEGAFLKKEAQKKAARKLNMIRGLGGIVDLGIGSVLAKSAGASSIDSLEMGQVLGSGYMKQESRNLKAEELAARGSAFEMARAKKLNYDEANKLALSFASVMDSSKTELKFAESRVERERLKRVVEKKLQAYGNWDSSHIDELFEKYQKKAQDYKKAGVKTDGIDYDLGTMNRGIKKDNYKEINYAAGPDEWKKSQSPDDRLRALKYEALDSEAKLLKETDADNPKILELEKQKRNIAIWQTANGSNMRWSRFLGETHLNILAFNQYIVQGGLIPAVIKGDFFDPRRNNLSPSEKGNVVVNGKTYSGIVTPRDDLKSSLYTGMTGIYYFTPKSIAKTLFVNGEGFVYMGYLKQQKIKNMIKGSDSIYNYVSSNQDKFTNILDGTAIANQKETLESLAENYADLLEVFEKHKDTLTDPELLKLVGELGNMQKKLKGSLGLKWADTIGEVTSKLSLKTHFQNFVGWGLNKISKGLGDRAKNFLIKGGVSLRRGARFLAKKAIHALGQALGFATTGGLANVLIIVVTEIIYFVGEKLLKPVVKVATFFVWGFALIFIVLFISLLSWLDGLNPFTSSSRKFDTAANTAPIFCEECGVGAAPGPLRPGDPGYAAPGEPGTPGDPGGGVTPPDGGPLNPPPEMSDVECPLQPPPLRCSQGPYGGFSHRGRNAIDVPGPNPMYWYAPSDGIVTRSLFSYQNSRRPGQLCGGIVHFYSSEHGVTYQLVHVVPYVSVNQRVTKGQPVAKIALESDGNIHFTRASGTCATGAHFHLENSGSSVYADRYYRDFLNCNLGPCP